MFMTMQARNALQAAPSVETSFACESVALVVNSVRLATCLVPERQQFMLSSSRASATARAGYAYMLLFGQDKRMMWGKYNS